MFNSADYNERLQTSWLGSTFIYLEKTDSTNSWLKKIPASQLRHGTVLLADDQQKGRGQNKRKWISQPGKNLTFTVALRPSLKARSARLTLLSLTAGLGIVRACEALHGRGFFLKWPNDVMFSQKKLGGILTETVFNGSKLERILIGIGVNVHQTEFSDELAEATSLASEFGATVTREELLCRTLIEIEKAYEAWLKRDDGLIRDINAALAGVGRWVSLSVNGRSEPEKMKFLGVDRDGHLIFLTTDIEVKTFIHEQIDIHDAC